MEGRQLIANVLCGTTFTLKEHLRLIYLLLSEWRPPVAVLDKARGRRHRVHRGASLYVHPMQGMRKITNLNIQFQDT